ncbi:MAG: hypothetical protein K6F56_02055 [Oscillospiraceae bacterium]|nr:hypothetical protein [Oscillospiraceae bacterium]
MAYEQGEWIMRGLRRDDPARLHSPRELIDRVNACGLLPLFRNSVPGFSVEEMTCPEDWWCGDPARDPWIWRTLCARSGELAYGKFFGSKAGFVSLEWLPVFANWRRDGYDFDARWDDGLASLRQKKLMDLFADGTEYFTYEAKQRAGFGKGGEKNFEGVVTQLQMQTYLVVRDFRCRKNRLGEDYGWPIAVLSTPESVWDFACVSACYAEKPAVSRERVYARVRELFPRGSEAQLRAILK